MTLFIATFSTLLAIINPLEALPVFLELAGHKDDEERRRIARRSCLYAVALMFFFLIFGTLILRVFGIPLSMGPHRRRHHTDASGIRGVLLAPYGRGEGSRDKWSTSGR